MKLKIKLTTPIAINGVTTNQLTMREPTVGDQLEINLQGKEDEAQREVLMFSRLTDSAPDDLKALTIRDLNRVQKAYLRLVADDDKFKDAVVEVVA